MKKRARLGRVPSPFRAGQMHMNKPPRELCLREMKRASAAESLPPKGLSNAHISCWVFGMRKTPTPPLPLWERASGLGAAGSLRPRRLGRKGEGWDLACSLEHGCLFMRRPVPHQVCLGSQARQGKPSSPNRERRRRWPARRQAFHPARCVHSIALKGEDRRGSAPHRTVQ